MSCTPCRPGLVYGRNILNHGSLQSVHCTVAMLVGLSLRKALEEIVEKIPVG